jgi:sporulation inhibitor KapD
MKRVIRQIDEENKIFGCLISGNMTYFYLTKSQAKKYFDYLDIGVFVDFKVFDQIKVIDKKKCYKVSHFNLIERKTSRTTLSLFDLNKLRSNMKLVLEGFDYYLFLDLEMTMPPYSKDEFEAEIIQIGYILTNDKGETIRQNEYYISPTKYQTISKRTLKFLQVERTQFDDVPSYDYFYKDFKDMIDTYHPKIVVWGKNDQLALDVSYQINKVEPLTNSSSFINLLQVHKNYYNLSDDVGLFKSYQFYYGGSYDQAHNAYTDALVTMHVFKGLISTMKEHEK